MDQDSVHEKILKEYLEYFKNHEAFERTPSVRNYANIRRSLKTLRGLIKERYNESKVFYYEAKVGRRNQNNRRTKK